jgi:hypothetical protein
MITQKMKYALKALMQLAAERAGEGRPLRIEEIATRSDTPKRFLEHILLEKQCGLYRFRTGSPWRIRPDQGPSLGSGQRDHAAH